MSEQTLGFAGLGRMGGPMSARLVTAGHRLVGYDPAGTIERLPEGASDAESIEDLAAQADIMLLSVPDGGVSRDICRRVVAPGDRRCRIVIDLSTIGIAAARECAATLAGAGVAYVDAPVSGGVAGARAGTLAMMIGAPAALVERVDPILAEIAQRRFRMGDDPGQGQAMKLLNNYAGAAALAATAEAAVFGQRLGLDLATIIDVLNASSGRSHASDDKYPRSVLPGTYDFGFAAALMTKDVGLFLESASDAGTPHTLADATVAQWRRFNAAMPGADFTAMHKYLEDGGC
jgi:3-hydroxyisobutyrate dehydrogenase